MASPDLRRYLSRSLDVLVPLVLVEVLHQARLNVRAVAEDLDIGATGTALTVAQQSSTDAVARRVELRAVTDRLTRAEGVLRQLDLDLLVAVVLARVVQHLARRPGR